VIPPFFSSFFFSLYFLMFSILNRRLEELQLQVDTATKAEEDAEAALQDKLKMRQANLKVANGVY
jgi:hypothetical protein